MEMVVAEIWYVHVHVSIHFLFFWANEEFLLYNNQTKVKGNQEFGPFFSLL